MIATNELVVTAKALFADHHGLLAMDESIPTCNRRFAALGIPQTESARQAYRELIIRTPGLGESISGAILCDETFGQRAADGTRMVELLERSGILPGIKVDRGGKALAARPGEKVTEGLDGLRERLLQYREQGARFAKWRAILAVGAGIPTPGCIVANAQALARYAALCQEAGLIPIVEPEVLSEGLHSLEDCGGATEDVLGELFHALRVQGVLLEALILKPNMVLPGLQSPEVASLDEVADRTLRCLRRSVPAAVPGVAFLSGGQPADLASARLNAMNLPARAPLPWALGFSFARAIQQPALEIWAGREKNAALAQSALEHRARCNRHARRGDYTAAMELPATSV